MFKFKKINLLIFGAMMFVLSCSKKEESSPKKEFEGYISASIMGKNIKAEYKPVLGDPLYNAYYKAEKNILFARRLDSKKTHGFRIEINDVDLDQVNFPIVLQHNTAGNPRVNLAYTDENDSLWQMNIAAPMMFQLTLDKYQNNRISGTFGGTLYLSEKDSLKIDNGKFEIELNIY